MQVFATGGCQAEVQLQQWRSCCVSIFGGEPEASGHAMALAIVLGLVCDPVGLVEIPCVRNAIGSGNALISADLALAGVESRIPVDEVIEAMDKSRTCLPAELRQTWWFSTNR